MSDKKECRGCIGISDEHTCPGYSDFLEMKAAKDIVTGGNCYKCLVKDKRIAELEADIERQMAIANELANDNERLRAGINRAGQLALQKASHETIRQVLAEALEASDE